MAFIDDRIDVNISYGAQGGPRYRTEVAALSSGHETRDSKWSYPLFSYNLAYGVRSLEEMYSLQTAFHAAKGRANGFRMKDWADYKSCAPQDTLALTDSTLGTGDGIVLTYQLLKHYVFGAITQNRLIYTPIVNTLVVGIDGTLEPDSFWSVGSTTGVVTFVDDTETFTDATSAAACEITTTTSHNLTTGDRVYLSTFTNDWAALNGFRYTVTVTGASTFTIAVNTSGYTAYSSDVGQYNTIPQSAEVVSAGFEFDVPVRFEDDQWTWSYDNFEILSADIQVRELRL